jgi:hypothetical protein
VPTQQTRHRLAHLGLGLSPDVGEDQRSVVELVHVLLGDSGQDGRDREVTDLGVDGPEHGRRRHHDAVGGERDQRAAAHRVVRHVHGDLPLVVGKGGGDLLGGQHQAARRVQHEIEGDVVDVDEAAERDAEEREALAAVDEGDRPRAVPLLQRPQRLRALEGEQALLEQGLEAGQDEEEPQQLERLMTCYLSTSRPRVTLSAVTGNRSRSTSRAQAPAGGQVPVDCVPIAVA